MAWCYEVRGAENRLVEVRCGFATEKEAREAAQRSKRMIDCICYPNLEGLTLVTKKDELPSSSASEKPPSNEEGAAFQRAAKRASGLKYPWQQAVLDAFLEPHPENTTRKINVAERAISARLLEADRFDLEERIALGEALLALRRLVREQSRSKQEPTEKKDIA